jgi:hypothetical protein
MLKLYQIILGHGPDYYNREIQIMGRRMKIVPAAGDTCTFKLPFKLDYLDVSCTRSKTPTF